MAKAFVFAGIGLVVVFAFFAVRWQLGDMLAELTPSTDPNISQISQAATTLAPSDPRTRWLAATAETSIFTPDAIDASVPMFGETIRLSPFDFRWWIEYGRALERAGQPDEAEEAFRQAITLAPNYAYPHWQLGNFYLREGRGDEAFAELSLTTESNQIYRRQVFALAWDYFGHQSSMVERIAADKPDVRSDLASFFALRSQPADALRIWNSLSDQEKTLYPQTANFIAQALFQVNAFREALEFSRQGGLDPDAAFETINNGGFESSLKSDENIFILFDWKIGRGDGKLDIAIDPAVRHSGARSLRMVFKSYTKQDMYQVWQNLALAARTQYKLSFWLRTENLKSGGPPVIELVNAGDNKLLATSPPFPLGTNGWQPVEMDLATPESSNGVFLRTSRRYCGETCPIVGTIWLDDFEIAKK
ncbi:MAG: tetratricopeptide repeat protein [Acidobacteriota bacterium]